MTPFNYQKGNPVRILSLDGGGSWALLEAKALGNMYGDNTPGHEILNRFDFAIGNSGGSLILAGLACGFTPAQMIEKLKNETLRKKIFSKFTGLLQTITFGAFGPKYVTDKKFSGLQEALGKNVTNPLSTFGAGNGFKARLLICGFNYFRERAEFFRTDNDSPSASSVIEKRNLGSGHSGSGSELTLLDAIHASSNAPLNYFNKPTKAEIKGSAPRYYWDGAVGGYNNPVLAGVIEVLSYGVSIEDIHVLSIGTGTAPRPVLEIGESFTNKKLVVSTGDEISLMKDVQKMATSILADPPDAASFMVSVLLDPSLHKETPNFVRMSPVACPEYKNKIWDIPVVYKDKPADFIKLIDLDMDAVKQEEVLLIDQFGDHWLKDEVKNQGIRSNKFYEPTIGQGKFSEAKRAWLSKNP